MSNPTVVIGNVINTPIDKSVKRDSFSRIVFQEQQFFSYEDGQYDPFYAVFDPNTKNASSERFFTWIKLDNTLGPTSTSPYEFLSWSTWENTYRQMDSGFKTPVRSIMPQVIVPTKHLTANGVLSGNAGKYAAWQNPRSDNIELFNWKVLYAHGITIDTPDYYSRLLECVGTWGTGDSLFPVIKSKNDSDAVSDNAAIWLGNPPQMGHSAPSGDWIPGDGSELVGNGAFMLVFDVESSLSATDSPESNADNSWTVKIEFGSIIISFNEGGSANIEYTTAADTEPRMVSANLIKIDSSRVPTQKEWMDDPYVICVYPVWNGTVIQNGFQDESSVEKPTSVFIPKRIERNIMSEVKNFDVNSPDHIKVDSTNDIPHFGSNIIITKRNCRFGVAYVPIFFTEKCWFDEWNLFPDTIPGDVSFTRSLFAIWSDNNTSSSLEIDGPNKLAAFPTPIPNNSYYYTKWRLQSTTPPTSPLPSRYGAELFGYILKIEEEKEFPSKNGNGSFEINFLGGTPADPAPLADWWKYITNVSVTVSLDGSSGSITVDKHGFAGQDAVAIQSIGAITIDATGGDGTVGGCIFQGLALGINEAASTDGATWNIPLVGLEKKMDDILLMTPPFMDGYTLNEAIEFLTRYAGIIPDVANAPDTFGKFLTITEDVNAAVFDWKSGTSVRTALDEVMDNVLHNYVVRDGKIFFYELGIDGLPILVGPDHEPDYPSVRIMSVDLNPDFEDIRNEILVIALGQSPEGKGSDQRVPLEVLAELRSTATVPDIPWAKSLVETATGRFTEAKLTALVDAFQSESRSYDIIGRISIAGNAEIKPYDRWGNYLIQSVTHNLDFTSKSWTTDLELHGDV